MQVTRAVDYGLRALVLMSREPQGARFFLQDLAERADLPRNYLVKILKSLASSGIVRSHRGIKGGFSLAREPKDISIRHVVEAIDGPVVVMHCLTDNQSCAYVGRCAIEVFFGDLRGKILEDLQNKSLQDIIQLQGQLDGGACPCHGEPCAAEAQAPSQTA